ncbi:DUF349 domain-containing protein [Halomonas halocynthiae]|uniref:DUF349 domain-containing protein n=1 Tax=Halomonas halocynthiae TaxID=176290 RepID=UPI00041C532E|nr:DUF349 domain-containing protein [Halomonas halocynthiae]
MRGIFYRLFAPRWQHPSANVRRQSIARLSIDRVDHRQALDQLMQDADAEVRREALAQLDDIECLLRLRRSGRSKELDERLVWLLSGHAGASSLSQRVEYLAQLDDGELCERIAMEGDNQQLRMAALARLDDEAALVRLACDNKIAAVRQAAAARVDSDEGLLQLTRKARRDSQVMRQARQRLAQRRADADQQAKVDAQREQLLGQIEQLVDGAWESHDKARFEHFEKALYELGLGSAKQEGRFREAYQRYRKVLSDQQHLAQAQRHARQRREAASLEREHRLAALEQELDNLAQGEGLSDQEIALLRSQKHLLAKRWVALSEQHTPNECLRRRYTSVLERYDSVLAARGRLDEHTESIVQALSDNDSQQLAVLVAACRWPKTLPLAPLLKHAKEQLEEGRVEAANTQAASLAAFRAGLERLQQQLDKGQVRRAESLYQRMTAQAEEQDSRFAGEALSRFKRLGERLAELRDWKAFVAAPKRQQLCESMEALVEQMPLSDSDLNQRHRHMVQEWKRLGDAAADDALAARFRLASDNIRQRLQPWRECQAQERERNLAERTALCEQLEALLDRPDAQADPDALRRIRDSSRQLWQRHSPVPSKQARGIERRFSHARHALQALIERRASEVAAAKRELIKSLEVLKEQEMDPHQRAEKAKVMQQQWRQLGRAPKGEEQVLWRDFRHLCDDIFRQRASERKDHPPCVEAMQALIDQFDAWRPLKASDSEVLDAAIKQAEALGPLPQGKRSDGMNRRWAGIVQARRADLERLALGDDAQS